MSRTRASRPRVTGSDGTIFLLIAAPDPTPHARSRPPVEVFTSEGVAREAFRRRRLEVGSGSAWAQLVAVEDQAVRALCWFGRPPGPVPTPTSRAQHWRRRRAVVALALTVLGVGWVLASIFDRAGAAIAPYVSKTALVSITASQRAEATAVNTSVACHRMEVWLIDGEGRTVASEASTVCPGTHLAVAYRPSSAVRLRSVVTLHLLPPAIVDPASHSFEVQDVDTGRTSVVVPAQSVRSR
jgi:hypothetical protein